jgi:hypothetical protein
VLLTTHQQHDETDSPISEIHSVAGAKVLAQFEEACAERAMVARVPGTQPVDSSYETRLGGRIR